MEHADEVDLFQYWCTLRRWRILIVVLSLGAGIVAFLVSRYWIQPYYTAASTILIRETNQTLPSLSAGTTALLSSVGAPVGSAARLQCIAILKSRSLASAVKRELGLPEEEYGIGGERARISGHNARLKVEPGKEGQVAIVVSAHKPDLAAAIANTYVKALREYQETEEISTAQRHLHFVEKQLARTKTELSAAEEALKAFQERNKMVAADSTAEEAQRRLWRVEADLASTQLVLAESRRRLEALRPRLVRRARSEGAPALANVQEIERLRGKLADLESKILVDGRAYRDEHPHMRELRASAEAIRLELRQYMQKAVEAAYEGSLPELIELEVAVIASETREAVLRAERDRASRQLAQLPESALAFTRLTRDVKVKSTLFEMLSQEYHRAKMAASQASAPVILLDPALVPKQPSGPRHKRNAVLAMTLGFMASIALAFVLDRLVPQRQENIPASGSHCDGPGETPSTEV